MNFLFIFKLKTGCQCQANSCILYDLLPLVSFCQIYDNSSLKPTYLPSGIFTSRQRRAGQSFTNVFKETVLFSRTGRPVWLKHDAWLQQLILTGSSRKRNKENYDSCSFLKYLKMLLKHWHRHIVVFNWEVECDTPDLCKLILNDIRHTLPTALDACPLNT